jgi:hypothetical protein
MFQERMESGKYIDLKIDISVTAGPRRDQWCVTITVMAI